MDCRFCDEGVIMEHISNLINTTSLMIKREESHYEKHLDPHVTDLINKIFAFFYAICRGFEKQYHDPNRLILEKTQWIIGFMDIGFKTLEQVQFGFKKCRLSSPINTPTFAEFVRWCSPAPDDLGLLTKEQAFSRSAEFMYKGHIPDLSADQNMIIGWTIQACDMFFLKNNALSKTQPLFYRNYEIACNDFIKGDLKPIPKAIENKVCETMELEKQAACSRDFGHLKGYEECMPVIRQMLGINSNGIANHRGMQSNNQKVV